MTNVLDSLLSDLRSRGVDLQVSGDRLLVDAPLGTLTDDDRAALSVSKPSILRRLAAEAQVLEMSLEEFEHAGFSIEIRVPWLPHTLWWVPRAEHVAGLQLHNVERGRVYTAKELNNLTSVLNSGENGREDLRRLVQLKLKLSAEFVTVEPSEGDAYPKAVPPDPRHCLACHECRFWVSILGATVCGVCHPPAAPELVERWLPEPESDAVVDPEMAS